MLEAVKGARRFAAAAPWEGFIAGRFGVMGAAETDDEILASARNSVVTIWHPTSSARMSPTDADYGVVDPDLLVKGVDGLRVVDASVFVSPSDNQYILTQSNLLACHQAYHSSMPHRGSSLHCRGTCFSIDHGGMGVGMKCGAGS